MNTFRNRTSVIAGLVVLGLTGTAALNVACGAGDPPAPEYVETGRAELIRMVVVRPDQIDNDEELWRIADHLQVEAETDILRVIFWTDQARAGRGVPLDYDQVDAEKAQININRTSGLRDLQRF